MVPGSYSISLASSNMLSLANDCFCCGIDCLNWQAEEQLVYVFQLLVFVWKSVHIGSGIVHKHGAVARVCEGAAAWLTD